MNLSSPFYKLSLVYKIATYYVREGHKILINTKIVNLIISLTLVILVIIYLEMFNLQVTKAQLPYYGTSMLVGTSETVRMLSNCSLSGNDELKIRQWIAGIIDGDGNFHISKKGYVELSVVMEPRDIACLYKLKQRYGGSIKATSHAKAVRFRLHHKAGILQVINDINSLILNPIRFAQLERLGLLYNIKILPQVKLDYLSAYLSGLMDTDGSVYFNKSSNQAFITVTQKHRYLLDLLMSVYGGQVFVSNKISYKWTIYKKSDVLDLIENYFHWNSCVSAKNKKFGMIKEFYLLSSIGALKAPIDSTLGKSFKNFIDRWETINNLDN
nr:hypothetical protein [Amanita phalloides]